MNVDQRAEIAQETPWPYLGEKRLLAMMTANYINLPPSMLRDSGPDRGPDQRLALHLVGLFSVVDDQTGMLIPQSEGEEQTRRLWRATTSRHCHWTEER